MPVELEVPDGERGGGLQRWNFLVCTFFDFVFCWISLHEVHEGADLLADS